MYGSANSASVPCAYMGNTAGNMIRWVVAMGQFPAGDYNTGWLCPLPTVKGSLKLYVKGIDVFLKDADLNNYIDNVYLYGTIYTGQTIEHTDAVNRTAPAELNITFTAKDMSGYDQVHVGVDVHSVTPSNLDFLVNVVCYYA